MLLCRVVVFISRMLRTLLIRIGVGLLISVVVFAVCYGFLFGPVDSHAPYEEVVILPDTSIEVMVRQIHEKGFVRDPVLLQIAFMKASKGRGVRPGVYEVSKSQDVWSLGEAFAKPPKLAYITITPGMRKEEIAGLLSRELAWTKEETEAWLTVYTTPSEDYTEGVFYPDTYLLPPDITPRETADLMRERFQEVIAPLAGEAATVDLHWVDVVNLASLVEREAARTDKELVAGILMNRLQLDMPLQVDATLQYIRGKEGNWWPVPRSEDKFIDSPFNTYIYKGLPPHPISNPSVDSIKAVIAYQKTDCVYYLHDAQGQIHCSKTYSEHRANIERYLK